MNQPRIQVKKYKCKCGFAMEHFQGELSELISIGTFCPECMSRFLSDNVPRMELINDEST